MKQKSIRIVAIVLAALLCLSLLPLAAMTAYAEPLTPEMLELMLNGELPPEIPPHEHEYINAVIDEKYLAEAGDCTPGQEAPFVYYRSCWCGESAEYAFNLALEQAKQYAESMAAQGLANQIDWDTLKSSFERYRFEVDAVHHYVHYEEPATCGSSGEAWDECEYCCDVQNDTILPATGEHSYGEDGVCVVCGALSPEAAAAQEAPQEEPAEEPHEGEQLPIGETSFGEEPGEEEAFGAGEEPADTSGNAGDGEVPIIGYEDFDGEDKNSALSGSTLTVDVAAPADYTYQWYRATSRASGETKITGETHQSYTLTDSDVSRYVFCVVTPTAGGQALRSAAYLVRKAITFNLSIQGKGVVSVTQVDGVTKAETPYEFDHTDSDAVTVSVIAGHTKDTFTIDMKPLTFESDSQNDYVVRFINSTEVVQPEEAQRSFAANVNTNGATYKVIFDVPRNYAEGGPTEEGDIEIEQSGQAATLVEALRTREAARLGIEAADIAEYQGEQKLRYVTPVWASETSDPTALTPAQLTKIKGFIFKLDYPDGCTRDNCRILVYHYNEGSWIGPIQDDATLGVYVKPLDDAIYVRYNSFSPFTVFGLPFVTLSFDPGASDASGTMTPRTVAKGETISVPDCAFTRTSFSFTGWIGSDGVEYAVGDSLTMKNALTLTAQWSASVQISFDKNAEDATGSIETISVARDRTVTLPLNDSRITRANFTFTGWKDQNGKPYADGAKFIPDEKLAADEDTLSLFAQWERSAYTVTYDGNEGGGTMEPTSVPVGSPVSLSANQFTSPPGMVFAGWSVTRGGPVQYADQATFTPTNDITLYAVWRNSLKVHFYPNGGEGSYDTQTVAEGVATALKTVEALGYTAPAGQTFAGWNTVQNPTESNPGTRYSDGQKITLNGSDVQLWAQWEEPVTITYHANFGSDTTKTQEVPKNVPTALRKNNWARTAYKFDGWMSSPSGTSVDYVDGGIYSFAQDTHLYAKWTKQQITGEVVIYDSTGSTSGSVVVGETLTAQCTDSVFTETDYLYQWNRNGVPIPGATNKTFVVPDGWFGEGITCTVSVKDEGGNVFDSKTSPSRTVGIKNLNAEVIDISSDGAEMTVFSKYAMFVGVTSDMQYSINGTLFNDTASHIEDGVFYAWLPGSYRFIRNIGGGTYTSDATEVTAWWSVGFAYGTSSSSGSSSASGQAKMYDNEVQLTSSTSKTTIKFSGTQNVWLVKHGSLIDRISIKMTPASGCYVHYAVNEGEWFNSGSEITRYLGQNGIITSPQLVSVIFNKSSSSPRTGDMSHLGLWSGLCCASLMGMAVILGGARKRRKSRA